MKSELTKEEAEEIIDQALPWLAKNWHVAIWIIAVAEVVEVLVMLL